MKQLKGRLPMTTLDTEPAFPVNGATSWYPGMTLRDYFAAQAIQSLAVSQLNDRFRDPSDIPFAVEIAYQIADAMMEASKQGGKDGTDI